MTTRTSKHESGEIRRRPSISVITCAYNEADCITELFRRLADVFEGLPQYEFDIVAVENGSQDATYELMRDAQSRDPRIRIVQLARNFGFDGGLTAGLSVAASDAVILMAADLEDPPQVIPDLLAKWEEGYENVYGIVGERGGTGLARKLGGQFFYWIIGKLAEQPIPPHARELSTTRPFHLSTTSTDERAQPFPKRARRMARLQIDWRPI